METKLLLSAKDAQKMGLSRTMTYQLLNRADVPVVQIGGRKFFHAEKFREWLDRQVVDRDERFN